MARTMGEHNTMLYRGVVKSKKTAINPDYAADLEAFRAKDFGPNKWVSSDYRREWQELEDRYKDNKQLEVPGEFIYSYYGPYLQPGTARGQLTRQRNLSERWGGSQSKFFVEEYVEELGSGWTRIE
jgi:hypothetical protein